MSILIYFAQKQKFDLQNGFCIASKCKRWCGELGSHIFLGAFYSVFMLPTLEYSSLAQTLPLNPRLIYPMTCWTMLRLRDISEVPDWVPHPLLPPLFTHSTQVFSTSVKGCLCTPDWSGLTFWNHPWLLYLDIQFSKTSCASAFKMYPESYFSTLPLLPPTQSFCSANLLSSYLTESEEYLSILFIDYSSLTF